MVDLAPLNYPIHVAISLGGKGYAGTWRERKTRRGVRYALFTFKERGTTRTIALLPPPATRKAAFTNINQQKERTR
jgi:hypothetical protein